MNGVIYARYSSDNQREESIEGQLRECNDFAKRNDITIIDSYIDRAFSATTDRRPAFQKMIKDFAKNMFDVIIVWKLDRFARNRYDSAHYKAQLRKNGVNVISANENISEGSEGIILESVLEGMAEYYSADLSEKVIRGLTENAMKCKFNSDPITFGFNFEPTAITSEHSCSEAFLCPNTAFCGGIRALFLCLKISRESLRDSKRQQISKFQIRFGAI